jgi:predicted RNA-binding protein YlqC (UPF0109 family)
MQHSGVKGATLKELVEFMAKSLVDQADLVQVSQHVSGSKVQLDLKVAKEDMGRVIGKGGKVANAMRLLLRVAAASEGKQASLDVIEPK